MSFASRMKGVAQAVTDSTRARAEFVADVTDKTQRVIEDARTMMRNVEEAHRERAKYVADHLNTSREDRLSRAKALRDTIAERMNAIREQMDAMLSETRKNREDTVDTMMETFQAARLALAADLQEAAGIWQNRERS